MKSQGHDNVDFDGCLTDVQTALQAIHRANPGLPVFLLGESMGGAIALRAASMYPDLIDGLISSVPAGDRFKQRRTDLKVALEWLKGPHHQFDIGAQVVGQATTNPKLKRDWEDNPLDRMDLSPKELMQFQSFMNKNHDVVEKITSMPVLMIQGMKDKLVKPEGTWDLFNEIASEQKVFLAVPGEHLIFENQQDDSFQFDIRIDRLVNEWIFSHLRDATSGDNAAFSASNDGAIKAAAASMSRGKPTVAVFYAPWAEQCKGVDDLITRAKAAYGTRVQFLKLSVEDPANHDVIAALAVGPVPTFFFLAADGTVKRTIVGSTNYFEFSRSILKLVPGKPRAF